MVVIKAADASLTALKGHLKELQLEYQKVRKKEEEGEGKGGGEEGGEEKEGYRMIVNM